MSRLIARMEVLLGGNVSRQANRMGRDMETMGERGGRAMERMDRRARMAGDGMAMLARRAGALVGAFIGIQEVRRMMTLEERIERLGVSAGKSTEEMKTMRRAINEVAQADDIRIDPTELLGAIEAFTEATGEIDIADKMKREIALAIQATGSGGQEIGKLMASIFSKFEIETPDDMLAALDLLARQGKDGAIELANLASLGPKVFSAYASLGKGGVQGLAEAGALMQVFKRGVGSADEAGTIFQNVFNALGKKSNLDKLRQVGVDIHDSAGALLHPVELLKKVVEAANGNDTKLQGVFEDAQVISGLRQLSAMFRKDGGFGDLDAIINLHLEADGTGIEADSARIAATAGAAATDAVESARSAVSDAVEEMKLLELFADTIGGIDKEDVALLFKAAGGISAIWAAFKVGGAVKDGVELFRSMRGGVSFGASSAGGSGKIAAPRAGAVTVQPVRVTNWPPGFGHGGARKGSGKGKVGGAALVGGGVAGAALAGAAVVGAVPTAAAFGSAYIGGFYRDIMANALERGMSFSDVRREKLGLSDDDDSLLGKIERAIPDPVNLVGDLIQLLRSRVVDAPSGPADAPSSNTTPKTREELHSQTSRNIPIEKPAASRPMRFATTDAPSEPTLAPSGKTLPKTRGELHSRTDRNIRIEKPAASNPMRQAVADAAAPAVAGAAGSAAFGGPDPIAPPAREGGEGGEELPASEPVDMSAVEDLLDEQVGETRALRETMDRLTSRLTSRPAPMMSRSATGRVELLP